MASSNKRTPCYLNPESGQCVQATLPLGRYLEQNYEMEDLQPHRCVQDNVTGRCRVKEAVTRYISAGPKMHKIKQPLSNERARELQAIGVRRQQEYKEQYANEPNYQGNMCIYNVFSGRCVRYNTPTGIAVQRKLVEVLGQERANEFLQLHACDMGGTGRCRKVVPFPEAEVFGYSRSIGQRKQAEESKYSSGINVKGSRRGGQSNQNFEPLPAPRRPRRQPTKLGLPLSDYPIPIFAQTFQE